MAADMASASEGNREIPQHIGKAMEDLSALRVRTCARARVLGWWRVIICLSPFAVRGGARCVVGFACFRKSHALPRRVHLPQEVLRLASESW